MKQALLPALLALAAAGAHAASQDPTYQARPVRVVVPFTAGSADTGRILDLPEIRERIAKQGATARRSTPEAFDKLVHEEIATRTKVWKAAGVKVE